MNLLEELRQLNNDNLIAGVEAAIGPVAHRDQRWGTVVAYYLDFSDAEIVTVYLVSAGRAIRHQHRSDDVSLTTCLPMPRIARVSQQEDPVKTSVVIEQDADRVTLAGTGQLRPGDDGGIVAIGGNLFPAAWTIEATEPKARARLRLFTGRLRAVMAS